MEEKEDERIEQKKQELKQKIDKFTKDKYLIILGLIMLFSLVLNIYYFSMTQNQAVWWDEAEYLSTAKKWVLGVPYNINPQRPPLYPLLEASVMFIGLPDLASKFLFTLIPSVLLILVTFFLGKKLFNKQVGLIAAFLMSAFWSLIFWTARFQPDPLSLLFQLLAIYFFYTSFIEGKTKHAYLIGIFAALAFLLKNQALIMIISLVIFALLYFRFSLFKKKAMYIAIIAFIILVIPFLIWQYYTFGSALAFTSGSTAPIEEKMPFNWQALSFIPLLAQWPAFLLFLLGFVYVLFNLFVGYPLLIKKQSNKLVSYLLVSVIIIVVYAFFIFIQRLSEDRWFFLSVPFIFLLAGEGLMLVYNSLKKYSKLAGIALIIILLVWQGYGQIETADATIKAKLDSYSQVKDASLYLKSLTSPGDIIMTMSLTQATYYSERKVYSMANMNETQFIAFVQEKNPKYMFVSAFEPHHPDWSYNPPAELQEFLEPIKSYQMNGQNSLIIFKINPEKISSTSAGSLNITEEA